MENIELPDSLDFSKANILVVGDIMLDRYWHGDSSRISPEAPVPVIKVDACDDRLGGAANVANNIKSLGATTRIVGIIGQDEAGSKIKQMFEHQGIEADLIESHLETCTKLRVIGRSQQLIRCDFEQSFDSLSDKVLEKLKSHLDWADVVLLSDYAKGTLSLSKQMIDLAKQARVPVIIDPKGADYDRYRGATLLTPNLKEFKHAVGDVQSEQILEQKAHQLLENYDFEAVLVTRGAKGMSLFEKTKDPFHVPALAREVFDITGAGDTVIATLACTLGIGFSKQLSAYCANVAAGLVVAKLGTARISIDELNQGLNAHAPLRAAHRKIVDLNTLKMQREQAKLRGQKIVFTNGCFDILHAGHVTYLAKARSFGEGLIVAINSDASVKKLKGDSRPINPCDQRMQVLAALDCVDWVVPFSDDTPLALIERLAPDVLVKGADYKVEEIAGSDFVLQHGGEVKLVDLVDGCSTTSTVEKIQHEQIVEAEV